MKIAIAGCMGRMGQSLVAAVLADPRFTLAAVSERGDVEPGKLAALGIASVPMVADVTALVTASDGSIHVIGTTGFSVSQQQELAGCAAHARIVQSGNYSLGVNLLMRLVEEAAAKLTAYDIEIFEMHHKHKKDAPSGTALMLGDAAARARGVTLAEKKSLLREGERKPGDIGFSVAGGGDVV
jgi:4-hydroxy-tetrahydrodipicolinate reductase